MSRPTEFVQIGDRIFNRRHIVALTNVGRRKTTVRTVDGDFPVDVPLSTAASALDVEGFAEAKS